MQIAFSWIHPPQPDKHNTSMLTWNGSIMRQALLANNQFRSTNNRYLTKKSTCWQPMLTSLINLVSAAPVNPGVRPTSQSTTISHIIILILFPTKSPHIFKRYTILAIIIKERSALRNPLFVMSWFHIGIAQMAFDPPPSVKRAPWCTFLRRIFFICFFDIAKMS